MPPVDIQKERSAMVQRPAHAAANIFQTERRLFARIWIARVEYIAPVVKEHLPAKFILTRLRENLRAPVADGVKLRRERILIHANLANGIFVRQHRIARRESIDV